MFLPDVKKTVARFALATAKPRENILYLGCYRDDNYRDLPYQPVDGKRVGLVECFSRCTGFPYV